MAGLALADGGVQSANVVGYIDYTGAQNALLWTSPTFVPVGTDGTAMKIGDIKVNAAFSGGTDVIRVFGTDGKQRFELSYLNAEDAVAEGADEGWYTMQAFTDWVFDSTNCKNNESLPYGSGFVFVPATAGAAVKYVGEVFQADKAITAAQNALLWTGNTSPKNMTLGGLKVNAAFSGGTDVIRVFGTDGKQRFELSYLNAEDAVAEGADEGWYTMQAFTDWVFDSTNCKNSETLNAGQGFVFVPATAGAALVVKNPVPTE